MSSRKRFSRAIEKAIYEGCNGKCSICGRDVDFDDGVLDHVIPLGNEGPDEATNLQWACYRCNNLKSNRYTNEEVRKILRLPESLDDLAVLKKMNQFDSNIPKKIEYMELPNLSTDGLNSEKIQTAIDLIQQNYQKDTIVPELFKTEVKNERSNGLINIGFSHRLPKIWFLDNQPIPIMTDPVFEQYGRNIALGELGYLENQMALHAEVVDIDSQITSSIIDGLIEEIHDKGFKPDVLLPTIKFWLEMHRMENATVNYLYQTPKPVINSRFKTPEHEVKILPPIGDIPEKIILFDSNAIKWTILQNSEHGALQLSLGNDRLYPLKYVECLLYTTLKLEINYNGIIVVNENSIHSARA